MGSERISSWLIRNEQSPAKNLAIFLVSQTQSRSEALPCFVGYEGEEEEKEGGKRDQGVCMSVLWAPNGWEHYYVVVH